MPRTTRASLAAAFAASFATSSSTAFPATCVSPTPGDRKATAMFRKRQRDWDTDAHTEEQELHDETLVLTRANLRAHHIHQETHPYSHLLSASTPQRQRRRRPSDEGWSSRKHADHLHESSEQDHFDEEDHHHHHDSDDEEQHHHDTNSLDASGPSPFKEIQSRVEQVGQQVALAQRNVAELRAMLRQALTSRRKALVARGPVPASRKARVRIDMLCS